MAGTIDSLYLQVATLGLAGILAAHGAFAAPPLRQPPRLQLQSSVAPRLDLRAPSRMPEAAENAAQRSFSGFPSRRPIVGAQESTPLPALAPETIHARPTLQEFVHRVHQEGLPVARLFEGKSALVHLGLSPKGKPGLWLVQKTH